MRSRYFGLGAIVLHEWRMLFFSPLTYLFQGAFLLALAACIFLVANFYTTDEATLRLLRLFIPWVSLVLIPALSMSAWADGHSNRELELVYALPIKPIHVVLGKYVAGCSVLLLTLLMTLPFCITLFYLGEPDLGTVFSSYLACALFLMSCFSLSLLAASLTKEPVGGFVAGLAVLFLVTLFGWDVFGRFLGAFIPQAIWEALSVYSPVTWLSVMGEGLIPMQGLLYFVLTVAVSLSLTHLIISRRRSGRTSGGYPLSLVAAGALIIWALGTFFAGNLTGQVDLTAEKEFTLHAGSKEVLSRLPADTELHFYWSSNEASVPAAIKSHAGRVKRLLNQMRKVSGLNWVEVDPQPDTDAELEALARRIHRVPMSSGDHFFLGLTVESQGRRGHIPYLDIQREGFLEYDIVQALNGLTAVKTPKVGILSPLLPSSAALAEQDGLSFMAELKRAYDVAVIPFFKTSLPGDLDALVLIGADILHEDMLYSIDQFLMSGGSLIVMMDPYSRIKRANNVTNPAPSEDINDISDLLNAYGATYEGEAVVGDVEFASPVGDGGDGRMNYPYWLRVNRQGLSESHPTTANLNELLMVEPGAFAVSPTADADLLVSTTTQSNIYLREEFSLQSPSDLASAFVPDGEKRVLALSLSGPFRSPYPKEKTNAGAVHRSKSSESSMIFAVADVDWIFDPFSVQRTVVGNEVVVRPLNDNLTWLLNMVEFATGSEALVQIRSRGQLQRPFTRVGELFRQAQLRLQDQESAMLAKVTQLEQQMGALSGQTQNVAFEDLPETIKQKFGEFQTDLLSARRALRETRREIRSDVESLGSRLTLINLLAGPFQILILAAVVFAGRARSSGFKRAH
ncbi:MAG: Gldg family protein [Gammaproteobacteria bacterium]